MVQVTISRVGEFGDGIAIAGGQQLRLPLVLPNEVVEVEDSRVVRLVAASPDRVQPFCGKFESCGGCKLQHWGEAPYAAWKRSLAEAALAAVSLRPAIDPLIDAHGEGRRRASLHVREQEGRWVAGYMEQKSHRLCALETCPVLVPQLRDAPAIAASFGPVLGNCDVSLSAADNGIDIAIKAERKAVPRRLEALQEIFQRWRLLRLAFNGEELMAVGKPMVNIGKAQVALPVQSFLQATQAGEDILAKLVSAGLGRRRRVADLFCGVGPFALRLAEYMAVAGFDSDKSAIAQLREAAHRTQGLKPVTAEMRDLFRAPLVVSELNEFDGAVFDPPRAGALAQARMIAQSKVERVVAVACDVQTFARDAAVLAAGGYKLEKVLPVDQFKWTAHLELVGWFRR